MVFAFDAAEDAWYACEMVDRLFAEPSLAALYDLFSPRERRRDFEFYMLYVMSARAVLDVGCGTGAMLHRARESGHSGRLCGLDPAVGMLQQARKRSDIEWILGDLSSVRFDGEFDLIVMTGHAFQVLVEDSELRVALAAIRSALTSDGRFAFETRNPRVREWERWTPDRAAEVTDATGAVVTMVRHVEMTVKGSTVSFTHTFTSPGWEGPQVSRSTLRFLDVDSLSSFLSDAGPRIEQQFGDWNGQPLSDTSPEIITFARRA
jgi:ubiquinone/menaquinone biosynthesis C-methylase UbiE